MKSLFAKRTVVINGHKTSVAIEEQFWVELKSIAAEREMTLAGLISMIDATKQQSNLSSALRTFVLAKFYPSVVTPGDRPAQG
jgi:predicted DNA-binding ribbon-helix-helix protein